MNNIFEKRTLENRYKNINLVVILSDLIFAFIKGSNFV